MCGASKPPIYEHRRTETTVMRKAAGCLLLLVLLVCWFCHESHSSTSMGHFHLSNTTVRGAQQVERSNVLFAQQAEDLTVLQTPPSLKLKKPYMAVFYAFVPGIIVHGSGHFYAGDSKTGTRLLLAEAAGGGLIFVGVVLTMAGGQTVAGFSALSGAILFVGSWVYDVVRSPLVVKRHNRELLETKQGQLRFRTKDGDLRLELVWRF